MKPIAFLFLRNKVKRKIMPKVIGKTIRNSENISSNFTS